jgi:hypothetical protein
MGSFSHPDPEIPFSAINGSVYLKGIAQIGVVPLVKGSKQPNARLDGRYRSSPFNL